MVLLKNFKPTRRQLLVAGSAGVASTLMPRGVWAQTQTSISTAFGWISNVEYAGFWTALEQGYFAEEGIAADFISGGPQAPDTLVSLAADNSRHSGVARGCKDVGRRPLGNKYEQPVGGPR